METKSKYKSNHIIYNQIFGTFEEEKEKVLYGMYSPPQSWNPIVINFHYYQILWKDAVAAPYIWDKFRLWFMPLGWRPRGLAPKPPLVEITVHNQRLYESVSFPNANLYLVVQLLLSLALMLMVIKTNSTWEVWQRWVGSFLLWHSIINWAGIMESKEWLFLSEMIRIPVTLLAVLYFAQIPYFSLSSLLFSALAVFCMYWTVKNFRNKT